MSSGKKKAKPLSLEYLTGSFRNPRLAEAALRHSSYRHEHPDAGLENFDRLEFFGDSILNYVICKQIYRLFPDTDEGRLTRMRSLLVSRKTLAGLAKKTGIAGKMKFGASFRGRQPSGFSDKVLADAFEAFLAALFLDQGMRKTELFIRRCFGPYINRGYLDEMEIDPKTLLQELCQRHWKKLPVYRSKPGAGGYTTEVSIGRRLRTSAAAAGKHASEELAAKKLAEQIFYDLSAGRIKKSSDKKLSRAG